MSFKKPFRAAPVRLGIYHRALERRRQIMSVVKIFAVAIFGGATLGGGMALYQRGGFSPVTAYAHQFAVSRGFARQHEPQPGDYWPGCDAARAAGVAPLYLGEPGYRPQMDGDNDGIACEPYRGR